MPWPSWAGFLSSTWHEVSAIDLQAIAGYLQTGQRRCFDARGRPIPCPGTGQDGELQKGLPWPSPRFEDLGDKVIDRLTGLAWRRSADLTRGPVSWEEALAAVKGLGKGWRLPNINELESLVDADASSPALPPDAPFDDVREAYWSSTTSAFEPDWAFALYLDKGAVGVGQKPGRHFFVWAVRDA
ncbi:MAG: DUF1566 domain-containing protein [Gammaproteobacteria bacterium]|nr:MAG: DUF1566 domain-containing protein [Gammaproteobacteria bacterium]